VLNRIKSLFTGVAEFPVRAPLSTHPVIVPEWLAKLVEPGGLIRTKHLYQQLNSL
jgi:hypothetical protein